VSRRRAWLLGAMLWSTTSSAQELAHAPTLDARPSEPLRIFGLDLPFRTAPVAGAGEFSVAYHLANTWNPTVALRYPDGRFKVYEADGVLRSVRVRSTTNLGRGWALELATSATMLVDGSSAADALASDRFIEGNHVLFLGQADPFQRRLNGLDSRAGLWFRDRNGDSTRFGQGDAFFGTLDWGVTRTFELLQTPDWLATASVSAVAAVPLNVMNQSLAAGLSPGAVVTRRVWRFFSVTLGAALPMQFDRLGPVGGGNAFIDRDFTIGYRAMLSLNATTAGDVLVSAQAEVRGSTCAMARLGQMGPVDPAQAGAASPYQPGTELQRSANAMRLPAEYFALALVLRPGPRARFPTFALYAQEDWKPLFGTRPLRGLHESDNAQDWAVGLRMTWPW
jgi:hypothetical protein